MKNLFKTGILVVFLSCFFVGFAQENISETNDAPSDGVRMRLHVEGNDTIFLANIREVTIFPPLTFRNRREENFYWRTVRDVRRTLPYARLVASEVIATNQHLLTLPDDRARREFMEAFEKELFARYEASIRRMTFRQGKMLIRLIEREVDKTAHDLIRIYRGRVTAGFWQGVARVFGADLRSTFNTNTEEDRLIERIIIQIEAGLL